MSKRYDPNQPRVPAGSSKGGQWAKRNEAERIYNNVYESDRKPVNVSLEFFSRKGNEPSQKTKEEMPPIPRKAYGFEDDRLNTDHHKKHVKEMGFKDQKEYVRAAIDFWERGQGEIYYSERVTGFYKYNKKSRQFLSITKDGTIRTFMLYSEKQFKKKFIGDRLHNV